MPNLIDEIQNNFNNFEVKWKDELVTVQSQLSTFSQIFQISYTRLTTINTWRELLIKNDVSEESYNFFCEAQNDGLSSHVFAGLGSWRAALKCLRSCIENILMCEYYKDHPIELRLWLNNKHRLGFNELINYFIKHPDLEGIENDLTGLTQLQKEYTTLSRAVHGTGTNFRMTVPGGLTNLWIFDQTKLNSWNTRERHTLTGINQFLLALHHKKLQGTRLPGLRRSIAYLLHSTNIRNKIKTHYKVNLDLNT